MSVRIGPAELAEMPERQVLAWRRFFSRRGIHHRDVVEFVVDGRTVIAEVIDRKRTGRFVVTSDRRLSVGVFERPLVSRTRAYGEPML